jgi:hypothetical protein
VLIAVLRVIDLNRLMAHLVGRAARARRPMVKEMINLVRKDQIVRCQDRINGQMEVKDPRALGKQLDIRPIRRALRESIQPW